MVCSQYLIWKQATGFSQTNDTIIEIAAQMLDPICDVYGEPFSSLIDPEFRLHYFTAQVTRLTDRDLSKQPLFNDVLMDFSRYITATVHQYEAEKDTEIKRIVLVAHTGTRFDFHFFFQKVQQAGLDCNTKIIGTLYVLDTLIFSSQIVKVKRLNPLESYNLGTLYKYVSGKEMSSAHRAFVYLKHAIPDN